MQKNWIAKTLFKPKKMHVKNLFFCRLMTFQFIFILLSSLLMQLKLFKQKHYNLLTKNHYANLGIMKQFPNSVLKILNFLKEPAETIIFNSKNKIHQKTLFLTSVYDKLVFFCRPLHNPDPKRCCQTRLKA